MVNKARNEKLQSKLLENKVISMIKIYNLINRIEKLEVNQESVDKKTYRITNL